MGFALYFMWRGSDSAFAKINWFLQRVGVIWLLLTLVIIAAVLHSIYECDGFH